MKGLGKNTRFKKTAPLSKNYRKGGATEIGKESQSYKEYVKTMFGGGKTEKKNKYADGGKIGANPMGKKVPLDAELKASLKKMGSSKNEIAKFEKEGINQITTIGKRKSRPLDNKRSRGRKYNPANARTKWAD